MAGVNEKKKKAKAKGARIQVTLKAQIYLKEKALQNNILQGAAERSGKSLVGWLFL